MRKLSILSEPTKVAELIEKLDWAATAIGPRQNWPQCLRVCIDLIVPSAAEIVMFWGPEFTALYNDAYAPTIGAKHPAAFGQPARQYWNELWSDLEPLLRRVLDDGETVVAKDRPFYLERHGYPETVYFDISYSPVREDDGKILGVFCIVNETTERIRSDKALRRSQERLQAIFTQTAAGIAQSDLAGRLTLFNDRYCEIVGYSRNELEGMRIEDITFTEDRLENERLFMRLVETGQSFDFEKRYVRKNGELVWVADSVSALRDDAGSVHQSAAFVVDITERKRAQEAQRHLAAVIASSNDAILGIDLDMKITSWNAAAERLYGYNEAEVVGQSVMMLVPEDRYAEEPAILDRIGAGLQVYPYETLRRRKDGQLVEVLLSVSPIHDAHGRPVGASKIAHDISSRKSAERLQALLIGELCHRVKNVLSTVIAIARQTLGRDGESREAYDSFEARLMSMARAHDILLHGDWQKGDLRSVVGQALSPYPPERFHIEGPSVALGPKGVVSFSLTLHELATNAAKYGALSVPEGRTSIVWNARETELAFRWTEENGPMVVPSGRRGFGSRLVERLLAAELGGEAQIIYDPRGVVCEIRAVLQDEPAT